ncbi:hypothetical protein M422DRAFT_265557 [Sphaerobolus stellatus SS14]|uniref:Uncharacterized protein n=1 Tax=Sphaerobolus stellatus (strain SS14) TaxID=990650 RepID=A0A0C9UTH9_SPHS4|nr:hypothetical protein M422DRAFT_265557 [Sphaerobolus stellatus SS14]
MSNTPDTAPTEVNIASHTNPKIRSSSPDFFANSFQRSQRCEQRYHARRGSVSLDRHKAAFNNQLRCYEWKSVGSNKFGTTRQPSQRLWRKINSVKDTSRPLVFEVRPDDKSFYVIGRTFLIIQELHQKTIESVGGKAAIGSGIRDSPTKALRRPAPVPLPADHFVWNQWRDIQVRVPNFHAANGLLIAPRDYDNKLPHGQYVEVIGSMRIANNVPQDDPVYQHAYTPPIEPAPQGVGENLEAPEDPAPNGNDIIGDEEDEVGDVVYEFIIPTPASDPMTPERLAMLTPSKTLITPGFSSSVSAMELEFNPADVPIPEDQDSTVSDNDQSTKSSRSKCKQAKQGSSARDKIVRLTRSHPHPID